MAGSKRHRIQFDFSDDRAKRLDKLVKKTDSVTKAATTRRALDFFEWAVEQGEKNLPINLTSEMTRLMCGMPTISSISEDGET